MSKESHRRLSEDIPSRVNNSNHSLDAKTIESHRRWSADLRSRVDKKKSKDLKDNAWRSLGTSTIYNDDKCVKWRTADYFEKK